MDQLPWVSFCISTYKRPALLKKQLTSLLEQSFQYFEIVVSDNDPEASAKEVVASFNERKIKYFHNGNNLGMMQSFNKSIDRATTEYIVMITDDDPADINFLSDFFQLYKTYPGYNIYCGFLRNNKRPGEIEIINKERFISEVLDQNKTPSILWSSCIIKKLAALEVGKIPDYNSPHLADHALIAMVGSLAGGVIINKMYSTLTQHDNNFSKFNFHYYTSGCLGFYETMTSFFKKDKYFDKNRKILIKHLGQWFISSIFNLKRYYTIRKNQDVLHQIEACSDQIIHFPFMRIFLLKYYLKMLIFNIKNALHLLK